MNFSALLITVVTAFLITSVLGVWMIPYLNRLHFGQTILDIGPAWHKNKQGTPTMGGFMFIIGILLSVVAGFCAMKFSKNGLSDASTSGGFYMTAGLLMALGFAGVGFVDDYIKVIKKRNLGLKEAPKALAQLLIAVLYLVAEHIFAPTTMIWFPFFGEVNFGIFYYIIMLFIIIGTVNSVNLTDGVDGLCSSVTMIAAGGFMVISAIVAATRMNLLAAALAGGCLGFLVWNFHPAKIFMGDTGSMFLGGMVTAIAFGLRMPVLLLFVGIIYVIEAMSDIVQVSSIKFRGKKVLKMAPIHHHFEMCGWSEVKIVAVFSAITLAGCLLAVFAVM